VLTEKGEKIFNPEWRMQDVEFDSLATLRHSAFAIPDSPAWPAQFDDTFWAEMAERCLSCRICAYVCPTCRCFDVRDEPVQTGNGHNRFERIRCWDSCAGTTYRQIAGGHNPRAAKGERLRNRFMCKFYYYPEQYGPIACTGCGRCVDACPVNIDITEVIQRLSEVSA
jgi:sulfhydrogenase subunit beta (sulfur reductase)